MNQFLYKEKKTIGLPTRNNYCQIYRKKSRSDDDDDNYIPTQKKLPERMNKVLIII